MQEVGGGVKEHLGFLCKAADVTSACIFCQTVNLGLSNVDLRKDMYSICKCFIIKYIYNIYVLRYL